MSRDEELRLIGRAIRGHAESFRGLVDAYKERLFAFVWRVVRDHHEAEDICQSAFAKAYESLASYSREYAFSTWLFTIAYRLSMNHLRKRRALSGDVDFSRMSGDDEEIPDALAGTEQARRVRDEVWAAVDRLTIVQKSAVLLFYRENKSCQEIGQILDVPVVTVKSHLHRAREKLRQHLSAELAAAWTPAEIARNARCG
ncbi:MAG: RNA polymerase sigma factor [Phycisphaerae bacterium]